MRTEPIAVMTEKGNISSSRRPPVPNIRCCYSLKKRKRRKLIEVGIGISIMGFAMLLVLVDIEKTSNITKILQQKDTTSSRSNNDSQQYNKKQSPVWPAPNNTCYTINHPSTYQRNRSDATTATIDPTTETTDTSSPNLFPVWVVPNHFRQHEIQHFLRDGVEQSPLFLALEGEDVYKIHQVNQTKVVWLVDQIRLGFRTEGSGNDKYPRFCWLTYKWTKERMKIASSQQNQEDKNRSTTSNDDDDDSSLSWPVHFIDWRDDPLQVNYCTYHKFVKLIGKDHVQYHKRSLVANRTFDYQRTQQLQAGHIRSFDDTNWQKYTSAAPKHVPYAVRTDTVREVYKTILEIYNEDMQSSCLDLASNLPRPKDVVHYWPIQTPAKINRSGGNSAHWREAVSRGIQEWAVTSTKNTNTNINNQTENDVNNLRPQVVYTDFTGTPDDAGRATASNTYIASMLEYKIVVVCQRNRHEDHYRLFEALVTGALVFTDTMLTLPLGLEADQSIIVYDTIEDMQNKLTWYLHPSNTTIREKIARRGRDISMRRHRSWHRVEEIVFGAIQS